MYARHRTEFSAPQTGGLSSAGTISAAPWNVGTVRQIAERARANEARRLIGLVARRLGDFVESCGRVRI